jgi:hypothetical protein
MVLTVAGVAGAAVDTESGDQPAPRDVAGAITEIPGQASALGLPTAPSPEAIAPAGGAVDVDHLVAPALLGSGDAGGGFSAGGYTPAGKASGEWQYDGHAQAPDAGLPSDGMPSLPEYDPAVPEAPKFAVPEAPKFAVPEAPQFGVPEAPRFAAPEAPAVPLPAPPAMDGFSIPQAPDIAALGLPDGGPDQPGLPSSITAQVGIGVTR